MVGDGLWQARHLIEDIEVWRETSQTIDLFAQMLEEKHSLDTLNFWLSLKAPNRLLLFA